MIVRFIYTRNIFSLFEEEFKQSFVYKCKEVGSEGLTTMYEIKRNATVERHQIVTFENKPQISICALARSLRDKVFCIDIF